MINIILEMRDKDNVLFTPHNAFNTQEALNKKVSLSITSIQAYLEQGAFPLSVKTP